LKTQLHAVNARWKRLSQRSLNAMLSWTNTWIEGIQKQKQKKFIFRHLQSTLCYEDWVTMNGDTLGQFNQHFMQRFLYKILAPKITKLKRLALRFFGERILVKNAHVICWWNWLLGSILSAFYEQLLRARIPKSSKKTSQIVNLYYAFVIYAQKLLIEHLWKWPL